MSDKASLHPDRITAAITALGSEQWSEDLYMQDRETCVAALRFVQKIQQKMGFTPTIADFGADMLKVLKGLKSLR